MYFKAELTATAGTDVVVFAVPHTTGFRGISVFTWADPGITTGDPYFEVSADGVLWADYGAGFPQDGSAAMQELLTPQAYLRIRTDATDAAVHAAIYGDV